MQSAFNLINEFPSYDNWVARGFILLADIYHQQRNDFQAKQTLISIIENHDGVELVQLAQQKLDVILASEEAEKQNEQQPAPADTEETEENFEEF